MSAEIDGKTISFTKESEAMMRPDFTHLVMLCADEVEQAWFGMRTYR